MNLSAVKAGLHERFAAVPDLAQYDSAGLLLNILGYEPSSIQTWPTIYTLFVKLEPIRDGQVRGRRYHLLHRLCLRTQDAEQGEAGIDSLVDAIIASVEADPRLGNRLGRGICEIESAEGCYVTIGGVHCRAVDFISNTLWKGDVT